MKETILKNTILITGASGTSGRELASVLRAQGADAIAASSSGKQIDGLPARAVDLADVASLGTAFAGIDTLFLLLPLQENMAQLARNAIAAAKHAGVRHIVRSSGAGADPASPFAIGRVQGEIDQLVMASGLGWTITRPANFMQNYLSYFAGMVRDGAVYLAHGDAAIAFVDTRDMAEANAVILQAPDAHRGRIYTLTGGQAVTNAQAVALIGEATGRPVQYTPVPDEAAQEAMRGMGMDAWSIDVMTSLNQVIRAGYAAGVSADLDQLLGRAPRRFADFASDYRSSW